MKNNKRWLFHLTIILSALSLSLATVACGEDDDNDNNGNNEEPECEADDDCDDDEVCNDDGECEDADDPEPDPQPDDEPDPQPDDEPDPQPDGDPVEECQATCAEIVEDCADDLALRCPTAVLEQVGPACDTACEDEAGQAQIAAAGALECPQIVPLAIDGFGLGDACFDFATEAPSDYDRVDRMGMPAVGTAVIASKDDYNLANPVNDVALEFAAEIGASLEFLHGALDDDLAALGLTPCIADDSCLDVAGPLVLPDTLKIDTTAPAGFPNGRLLADPVIDVTLAVVLLEIADGTHSPVDLVGALNPTENDVAFRDDFPFLADSPE